MVTLVNYYAPEKKNLKQLETRIILGLRLEVQQNCALLSFYVIYASV
jgi:hypothetical protein